MRVDSTSEQTRRAKEIHVHPQYNTKTSDYDLALIKLESPVQLNDRVKTACLPGPNTQFPAGTNCIISGWGKLREGGSSPQVSKRMRYSIYAHFLVLIFSLCVVNNTLDWGKFSIKYSNLKTTHLR